MNKFNNTVLKLQPLVAPELVTWIDDLTLGHPVHL